MNRIYRMKNQRLVALVFKIREIREILSKKEVFRF